jgi:hypothetical protein
MESHFDLALVALLVLGAFAFAVWRMALAKKPPACAPDGETKPQVILGGNLARGLKKVKASESEH